MQQTQNSSSKRWAVREFRISYAHFLGFLRRSLPIIGVSCPSSVQLLLALTVHLPQCHTVSYLSLSSFPVDILTPLFAVHQSLCAPSVPLFLSRLLCPPVFYPFRISDVSLKLIGEHLGSTLLELALHRNDRLTDEGLLFLATSCPSLRRLSLSNCPHLANPGIIPVNSKPYRVARRKP